MCYISEAGVGIFEHTNDYEGPCWSASQKLASVFSDVMGVEIESGLAVSASIARETVS